MSRSERIFLAGMAAGAAGLGLLLVALETLK